MSGTVSLQYDLLFISLFLGVGWSYLSGAKVSFLIARKDLLYNLIIFIIFFFIILFLNFKALQSGIPWRGDEAYHIVYTLKAVFYLFDLQKAALFPFLLIAMVFLTLAYRKSILFIPAGIVLILFLIFSVEMIDGNQFLAYGTRQLILRYPFPSRYLHAVIIFIARFFGGEFNEMCYRIVPFMCTVILAWYTIKPLIRKNIWIAGLWGIAIGTMPVIVYYTSTLYLEIPAIILMTVVCLNAEKLLTEDIDTLRRNPAWYALLLIGFIKDNTPPFLLCFLVFRFIKRILIFKSEKPFLKRLGEEAVVWFCVLLPLILFLFFQREFFDPGHRGWDLSGFSDLLPLLDYEIYRILFYSFFKQIGIIIIFFIPGIFILLKKKRYNLLLFLCLNIFSISLFHLLLKTKYTGYSRFNLLLVPAFLAGSHITVKYLVKKYKIGSSLLLIGIIICNLRMSPLNVDGTKKPFWGNPMLDTSEHYYPYREMILWLKEHYASEKILFANNGFPYRGLQFYLLKFNWNPKYIISDDTDLNSICRKSDKSNIDIIVFKPSPDNPDIVPVLDCGYSFKRKISNMAYSLILYTKDDKKH